MSTKNRKSIMGWLLMGAIAIVAAVFHESWIPHLKKVPLLKDAVEALEAKAKD